MKSIPEVSAAILALRGKRNARQIIEERADAQRAESGEQVGSGVFSCEPPQKPQTNFKKRPRDYDAIITEIW